MKEMTSVDEHIKFTRFYRAKKQKEIKECIHWKERTKNESDDDTPSRKRRRERQEDPGISQDDLFYALRSIDQHPERSLLDPMEYVDTVYAIHNQGMANEYLQNDDCLREIHEQVQAKALKTLLDDQVTNGTPGFRMGQDYDEALQQLAINTSHSLDYAQWFFDRMPENWRDDSNWDFCSDEMLEELQAKTQILQNILSRRIEPEGSDENESIDEQ